MTQTLGAAIRARRIEMGWTQEDLAKRIDGGMRQAEISRLEIDRITLPRRERLECIARALGLPVGELLERAGWTGASAAFGAPAGSSTGKQPARPATSRDQSATLPNKRQMWGD